MTVDTQYQIDRVIKKAIKLADMHGIGKIIPAIKELEPEVQVATITASYREGSILLRATSEEARALLCDLSQGMHLKAVTAPTVRRGRSVLTFHGLFGGGISQFLHGLDPIHGLEAALAPDRNKQCLAGIISENMERKTDRSAALLGEALATCPDLLQTLFDRYKMPEDGMNALVSVSFLRQMFDAVKTAGNKPAATTAQAPEIVIPVFVQPPQAAP